MDILSKNKKTVSLLILTYNRLALSKEYIPQIINRVGNVDAEILIWDNFSNDGTYDWLLEYEKADPRITKVFGSDENIGMEAINYMAEEASGKYILKIDDDVEAPAHFAERLVRAYEDVNEERLLFLGWDLVWTTSSFALRSGKNLYKEPKGKQIALMNGECVFINYTPSKWLVNGVCRLSEKEKFLDIGGHPKGIKYGVDSHISKIAENNGYWVGFFHTKDLVIHRGTNDTKEYRAWKTAELRRIGSPLDP